jgi:hypothetical protein
MTVVAFKREFLKISLPKKVVDSFEKIMDMPLMQPAKCAVLRLLPEMSCHTGISNWVGSRRKEVMSWYLGTLYWLEK